MHSPIHRLLALGTLVALGACAEVGDAPRPMASITPLELVGLSVQSGDRLLGTVEDVVLSPDRRAEQVVVASGSPVFPVKRRTALDTGYVRFSSERQALILTGMTAEEFTTLQESGGAPPVAGAPIAGAPVAPVSSTGSTNWTGVTTVPPR